MAYGYNPIKKLSANGVFHTDGIGVVPNDPTAAYKGLQPNTPQESIPLDSTVGKSAITEFNQKAQLNTTDTLANRDELDLARAYGQPIVIT